ncbi:Tsr1p [Sugiyamaella lignohabitans]|uniref:Tsr1p n=1 Tax=Sugiyamaella lignohabitans TaxID=796027 RepID=A0A167FUI1_9ASCO|nr:Tsr1p [Sugiyamaella lignohabitans]ANB15719.1 Tsr1p [Sugiyamaella lignohabitans]
MAGHSHRPSVKNGHKPFKSKHASKSALKTRTKGKVEKEGNIKGRVHVMSKQERRNTANQLRSKKVIEVSETKKIFDGRNSAPKIVTVIPLSEDCDPSSVVYLLNEAASDNANSVVVENPGSTTIFIDRFKQKLRYIIPKRNFIDVLDAAKVADFVIFVLSSSTEVDELGESYIRSIESQGVSNCIAVINPGISDVGNTKKQTDVRGSLLSYFTHFFPTTEKIYAPEISAEALNVTRLLCQKFPSGVGWRDARPYILAESVGFDRDTNSLTVEGYLRGKGLNADRLVHIPGFGDYQIEKIVDSSIVPKHKQEPMEEDERILAVPSENQENLEELVPVDEDMDSNDFETQTMEDQQLGVRLDGHHYFTRQDLHEDYDSEAEESYKRSKPLPSGTSEYQATWIIDNEEDEANDEEQADDAMLSDSEMHELNGEEDSFGASRTTQSEYAPSEAGDVQSELFVDLSAEEESRQLEEFRARAKEDLDFPDEIEIPPNVSARERLHRYRGLKNLRTCTWDVNEKDPRAPEEWSGLTRIANFKATRNRVAKQTVLEAQVQPGARVKLFIRAPEFIASSFTGESVFVVYGLLQHEHQLSVVNLSITPNSEYAEPVASKDALILQCGPRRLVIRPLFSQAGSNASNNVYKYERFLQPGRSSTATVIAPITMGNVPVLYFKQNASSFDLVGTGSVMDTNVSRILAKRVILTGHPLKIHKKLVTIRYMFFNPEDILWFKAVPLFTKLGRSGYIKESLGTHGYFKATFDGKITSQDTVGMALYKRVWPRASTLWTM